jgi:hypothetical protein
MSPQDPLAAAVSGAVEHFRKRLRYASQKQLREIQIEVGRPVKKWRLAWGVSADGFSAPSAVFWSS